MVVSEHTRFNRTCDPHFIESVVLCQHRGGCLRLSVSQESSMPCSPRAQMSPQGLNLSAHTSGIYLATWLGQQGGGRQVPKPTWSSQTTGWDCGSGSAPPEGCKWRRPETLPGWLCAVSLPWELPANSGASDSPGRSCPSKDTVQNQAKEPQFSPQLPPQPTMGPSILTSCKCISHCYMITSEFWLFRKFICC